MKDVLLKIAESCYDEETTIDDEGNIEGGRLTFNKDKFTTEIADIVKDFDEWKDSNCEYKDTLYLFPDYGYWMDYDNLFRFWYNEIRERT